jgi:hypothetical protein
MKETLNPKKEILRYLSWFFISVILVWISFILVTIFTTEIPFPKDYCLIWDGAETQYCVKYKSKLIHAIMNQNHYLQASEKHNWVYFGIFSVTILISLGINLYLRRKSPLFFGLGRLRDAITVQTIILPLLINLSLGSIGRNYYLYFVPNKITNYHKERVNEELQFCKWIVINDSDFCENDPD